MALCSICNNLQVDATTNESPDDTNWPGPDRLRTFSLSEPMKAWRKSAEQGCATCRLIWDGLLHFYEKSVSELEEVLLEDDEPVHINLGGILGETLLLELHPLSKGMRFPGLEFYTSRSAPDAWPIMGPAEEISRSLDLDRCLELCKRWIHACEQKHPQCQADRVQALPTRVLDLGELDRPVSVRLHEPPPNSKACFVALSYCWGGINSLITTTSNLAERKAGIPWDLLHKSFRDAILICRGLGVRYLWIDALCIIQDSTSDWEKEAARMADVYENAFFTIATDAARDPTWGILTPRHLYRVSAQDAMFKQDNPPMKRNYDVLSLPIKDDKGVEHLIKVREPLMHTDIVLPRTYYGITYPLLTRAWTMQERLLARRTLHFTAFELIWECKETLFCECGCISREFHGLDGDSSPKVTYERAMEKRRKEGERISRKENVENDLHLKQLPQMPETTKSWTMIIGGYSVRQLTFVTDRLPAISSLAQRFATEGNSSGTLQPESDQTYLAGLWLTDLAWLLCWRAFQWRFEQRTAEYCAPTWSWASISTPVIWDSDIYNAVTKIEISGTNIRPQGLDKFGRVRGGGITLKGNVKRATLDFKVNHHSVLGLKNEMGERIFFIPDQNLPDAENSASRTSSRQPADMSFQRSACSLSHGEMVVCLWVLHDITTRALYGLVLASPDEASIKRSVGDSIDITSSSSVYERVGLITSTSRQYQKDDISAHTWFMGAEEEVITLI